MVDPVFLFEYVIGLDINVPEYIMIFVFQDSFIFVLKSVVNMGDPIFLHSSQCVDVATLSYSFFCIISGRVYCIH